MRRAEIRTELDRADAIAAAIRPDNTAQMDTRVEDGAIVTTIERETTGGLRSTVDDYVVNLDVARRTLEGATSGEGATRSDHAPTRSRQHEDHDTSQP